MNRRLRRLGCAFSVAAACLTAIPAVAQPQRPLFGLRPSQHGKTTLEKGHFQYAVRPGTTVEDAVEVVNLSARELRVEVYSADMKQAPDGSLSPADDSEPKRTVGKWLELQRSDITLAPEQTRYVAFSIAIPAGTQPGDHVGAVVGSVSSPSEHGNNLNVESRVALIARVRVPGEPELAGEIGPLSVTGGRTRAFEVEVRNTGNLLFTARGSVDISSGGGRVASVRLSPPDIYLIPGGKARFRAEWGSTPVFGGADAAATFELVSAGEDPLRVASVPVAMSFFSWPVVGAGGASLLLLALVLLRRRRRNVDASSAGYRVPAPSGATR